MEPIYLLLIGLSQLNTLACLAHLPVASRQKTPCHVASFFEERSLVPKNLAQIQLLPAPLSLTLCRLQMSPG